MIAGLRAFLLAVAVRIAGPTPPPARTSWAWCPRCRRDLNGDSESFDHEDGAVYYRCASCACLSWWDFDAPVPLLLGSSHAPTFTSGTPRIHAPER
jgi:hypothetical protein